MKKTLAMLFLLSVCSLAVAVAQSPDQPQTGQQTAPSSSHIGKNITVTGCLRAGTEPNSYVLHNVTPSDMSQQSSQRDSNYPDRDPSQIQDESRVDTMPSEMAKTEDSYTLIPDGRVDLKSHVGERVEVTGKMSESTSRTEQSSRATTPAGQSSSIHSSTEMTGQAQFKVSSIRRISQSCQ